ncbi:hypothetical protein BGW36DRAFT_379783 [Talaromyces proteolyticus]|uniref:Zn(2)-C6 fungal-type domain-containing protein n=1 Tax=Talaromyces proteolyticus TaxID=1131652 RepID=A0AAD4PWK9_9EURO|nr:uncharacterized protein BGW36DRAFT_379783 [Talaromyces proteolyticus]KAH8697980.1 hypothetical protein BGW36DRAFT_379783 [Talaromyces proteolyticus]
MVYCGKPSRGCANCRKRKIRCDLAEPSCLKCQRARFSCPGYRNLIEVNFRDQSQEVVRKACQSIPYTKKESHIASTQCKYQDLRPNRLLSTLGVSNLKRSQTWQIDYALSTNPRDQSICVFLHNFAPDDSVVTKVHLTTSQIISQATSCYAVRCAISAIGLAFIANTRGQPSLLAEAREEYATALHLTNMALMNERMSLEDTTLSAVILLGMFEVMAGAAPKSVDNWQKHINGAATLLQIWGSRQKLTLTGIQLFMQLRAAVMANCLRTQTRVPETIKQLSKVVTLYRSEEIVHSETLVNLVAEVSDFIAEVRADGIPDYVEVIERAKDLDKRLEAWTSNLSTRWQYAVHTYSGSQHLLPNHTCNGSYHLYPDIWACNIWAYYRTARIILNLVIRDRIPPPPNTSSRWGSVFNAANRNIENLAVDILLSVPFSVSLRFSPPSLSEGDSQAGGCLGGYSILWPLYVAASVSAPNSLHRKWAANRLEYIGHTMGIGQAFLMAKVVRNELPHECLSIYDYCRSYRPSI